MKKFFILFCFLFSVFCFFPPSSRAQDTTDIQKQIDELEKKLSDIKDQSQTLSGQIAYYDNQIALNKLKISQTETLVSSISGKINNLEISLQDRVKLLRKLIAGTYKNSQLEPIALLFSSGGFSQGISAVEYAGVTQSYNRRLLHDTQMVQANYSQQKQLIEASQTKLKQQKLSLSQLREEKNTLLAQTKNDEAVYQKLLAQAIAQRDAMGLFTAGGDLLPPQPSPDGWYMNQRDERWGTTCIGSTCSFKNPSPVWRYGCLITSIAMLQKKNGIDITPRAIALNQSYFFQDYMLLPWPAQSGFKFTRSAKNMKLVDSELSAGRPVVIELLFSNRSQHFIVLKSKDGSDYVMNDPWFGPDLKFTGHYSFANINSVSTYTKT
jgi:peptidoglycan hydrolase CwlO-like protein